MVETQDDPSNRKILKGFFCRPLGSQIAHFDGSMIANCSRTMFRMFRHDYAPPGIGGQLVLLLSREVRRVGCREANLLRNPLLDAVDLLLNLRSYGEIYVI